MEFIRGLHNLQAHHRGCVLTVGNFDGVHRGHREVIDQLGRAARELKLPVLLMTFEPQPQEYFRPDSAPARLTRLREKLNALKDSPIDRVLCLPFNQDLAATSAEDFIETLLVDRLGVKFISVGDDFRFGHAGKGDITMLREAGKRFGFELASRDTYELEGARVSSSRVRAALAAGEFDLAATLLGRPYTITGKVMPGEQRGRTIGFPTANIALRRKVSPLYGVFAVRVSGTGFSDAPAVANIGSRPTVGGSGARLEVHLLDYSGDLYGEQLSVRFATRLREEKHFESFAALKQQIQCDSDNARDFFAIRA